MTNYRYLGYGTTNSNGVAHLDHDPQGNPINGYTGTGAGEIDVLASTDNPITSSSIVSEPYPVFDCPVYDGDNTPTSISWSKTNNAVVTDEVVSLIASVLNTNNNPCINIPVVFTQGNTVLGTAYTDCNGDATMTYTWADSDIFNVTAQVGQSLSEDITMFVKDKNNLLTHNQWTGTDVTHDTTGFTPFNSTIESSISYSSNGNRSLKVTVENTGYKDVRLYPPSTLSTGITVICSVKILNPNGRVYVRIYENNDQFSVVDVPVSREWQLITVTQTLTSELQQLNVASSSTPNEYYVDDISLVIINNSN